MSPWATITSSRRDAPRVDGKSVEGRGAFQVRGAEVACRWSWALPVFLDGWKVLEAGGAVFEAWGEATSSAPGDVVLGDSLPDGSLAIGHPGSAEWNSGPAVVTAAMVAEGVAALAGARTEKVAVAASPVAMRQRLGSRLVQAGVVPVTARRILAIPARRQTALHQSPHPHRAVVAHNVTSCAQAAVGDSASGAGDLISIPRLTAMATGPNASTVKRPATAAPVRRGWGVLMAFMTRDALLHTLSDVRESLLLFADV